MLVLSRVVGELISIGDNISLRVLAVNGTSVRFGIEAPEQVNVHRAEVYERIQRKQANAKGR
ncbi:carbon storage regulator CsrA [Pseudomonas sp. B2M1-30]|uniref:Translational regulator CsrA n=1 Tax=Pseudomonas koreensis TaxID=198620 RepID=A0A9X3B2Y7_9PSED|nr:MULTISPECIES: carbon storage regulator CsrA [Pseudomonas]MBV4474289.1 carbon storage regulator CsrA [Pseudomonas botevensis]MCU0119124.1 carbon storage regulator CsrA [Pseudomonas sp. B2M1-30]MCU7248747.1 carbon storage regulator CsrA [Pseudomonas koreensis]MCU7261445.1 carbon storage regulator CsrA [Pseudomonas koreensis]